jgi:hypothetical protein
MPTEHLIYNYRIYCNVDQQWEYIWDTVAPTICPINDSHEINPDSISSMNDLNAVTITSTDSPYDIKKKSVFCNTVSGNIILNLKKAFRVSSAYIVIKKTHSANTVTITPNTGELIDGLSTKTLSNNNEFIILKSNGTGWITIENKNTYIDTSINENILTITGNKGELLVDNGTTSSALSIGSTNEVLTVDLTTELGLKWSSVSNKSGLSLIPRVLSNTSTTYTRIGTFVYTGTTNMKTISSISAVAYMDTAVTSYSIKIINRTNNITIVENTFNNTSESIINFTPIANIPTGQVIIEILIKKTGGTGSLKAYCDSITFYF